MSPRLPAGVGRLPVRVRLAAAIEGLPELDRRVLELRLLEGLSALECAGTLRLSVREVERRHAAVLLLLARELASRPAQRRAA